MADSFDPYHKWLGIPPKDQPPNHYRLLGIDLFESDPEVIDAAANRQMAYIQSCAEGPHLALSQQLLNEVSAARVCLLNKRQKAKYDAELRGKLSETAPPPPPPRARARRTDNADGDVPTDFPVLSDSTSDFVAPDETIFVGGPGPAAPSSSSSSSSSPSPYRARPSRQSQQVYWIATGAGVLVVLVAVLVLLSGGREEKRPPEPRIRLPYVRPPIKSPPKTATKTAQKPRLPDGPIIDDDQVKLINRSRKKRGNIKRQWRKLSTAGERFVGKYYLSDDAAGRGDFAAEFPLPSDLKPGRYRVLMSYVHGAGRASNVRVVIQHAGQISQAPPVNQRVRPKIDGQFHDLGIYGFDGRQGERVLIHNKGANGNVIADAVKWVRVGDLPKTAAKPPSAAKKQPAKKPAAKKTSAAKKPMKK